MISAIRFSYEIEAHDHLAVRQIIPDRVNFSTAYVAPNDDIWTRIQHILAA